MLENRPILKDRLCALAVFSGIAIGAVAGFELVITGGFDWPERDAPRGERVDYLSVSIAPSQARGNTLPVSYADFRMTEDVADGFAAEDLAGARDQARVLSTAALNEEDLAREIERLYVDEPVEAAPEIAIEEDDKFNAY